MSMRLYCRADWREELSSKWKLRPTGTVTATTEIWLTPMGRPVSIPELGPDAMYPDSLLNLVEEQLRALGEHPFASLDPAKPENRPVS
jgi:hypothetical protein